MSQITINRIRFAVDNILKRQGPLVDKLTGVGLTMYQAETVQIEVGVYSNAAKISDLTNYTSFTMLVKDPENLLGAPLITSTVAPLAITDPNWQNDSAQDALFTLAASDTNIELQGKTSRKLNILIFGTTATAQRIPLSKGDITLVDSLYGDLAAITVTPPGARMKANKLQVKNQTNGLYYDAVLRIQDGTIPTWSLEGAGEA